MSVIRLQTYVEAPPSAVFDASRSIRLHLSSMTEWGEEVVAATAEDLLGPSDEVTWRARQFGFTFDLSVRVVEFDPPHHFRDSMVRGPFVWMHHDHHFRQWEQTTEMQDAFAYALPFGPLGQIADLAVRRRVRRLLEARCRAIKEAAERG